MTPITFLDLQEIDEAKAQCKPYIESFCPICKSGKKGSAKIRVCNDCKLIFKTQNNENHNSN